MRHPPPLNAGLAFPITTCVAFLAIAGTVRYLGGADVERFMFNGQDWLREPWRLVTPALFHANAIHLLFNLYWLWVFGTLVETEFGHGPTLGIYLLLAAGSETAEFALFHQGIGLSGVNYGLFGLLWVLSRHDPRFRDAVDRQTVQLMVGWFFLCIVLTVLDVWRVANVAHGAGFVLGAILGWTIAARGLARRLRGAAVLAAVFLLCLAGGTIARPYVNLTGDVGHDFAYRGYVALESGDDQKAVALYEKAVAIDPNQSAWWNNLGVAYRQLGRTTDASRAFRRAAALRQQ
jgi:membrane associated rhomboid family serine protease